MSTPILVAAVQVAPVFLDREGTIDKVCDLLAQAADQGAGLVVFPEAFVPGYPDWVWRTPAWRDGPLYRRLWEHAVELGSPTRRLGEAAAAAAAWVAIGVNERDTASATLYNTLCTSDRTARWPAPTASWCRPAASARCGALVTAPP